MSNLSVEQVGRRERTLLAAVLLSMWGPLATGIAVVMSSSTTQAADFVRRSVELVALVVSWWVFRVVERGQITGESKGRWERIAGVCVAGALCCSGLVMLALALTRMGRFQPGGNVYVGMVIAGMGLIVNAWFWRRYTVLVREEHSVIIDAQRQLYLAKIVVDLCVVCALTAVAVYPGHVVTGYVDVLGSVAVSGYLLWSGVHRLRVVGREAVQEDS